MPRTGENTKYLWLQQVQRMWLCTGPTSLALTCIASLKLLKKVSESQCISGIITKITENSLIFRKMIGTFNNLTLADNTLFAQTVFTTVNSYENI